MGWCACSRKCTRCLGSRGGDADGWSASASILCIPWQPLSSKALPRFSGDVYTCVVGAKSWQLQGDGLYTALLIKGSCPSSLRVNTRGLPGDPHEGKKA